MDSILAFETELFLFLNNLGSLPYDRFWLFLSNEFSWIPLYLIILLSLYSKLGKFNFLKFIILFGMGLFISDSLSMWCKETTLRFRPCKNEELTGLFRYVTENMLLYTKDATQFITQRCRGNYSFFSAHSSSFAFMGVVFFYMYKEFKYSRYLFLIWALLIGFSRIYLGAHFPFDVIVGLLVGAGLGYLVLSNFNENNKKTQIIFISLFIITLFYFIFLKK